MILASTVARGPPAVARTHHRGLRSSTPKPRGDPAAGGKSYPMDDRYCDLRSTDSGTAPAGRRHQGIAADDPCNQSLWITALDSSRPARLSGAAGQDCWRTR